MFYPCTDSWSERCLSAELERTSHLKPRCPGRYNRGRLQQLSGSRRQQTVGTWGLATENRALCGGPIGALFCVVGILPGRPEACVVKRKQVPELTFHSRAIGYREGYRIDQPKCESLSSWNGTGDPQSQLRKGKPRCNVVGCLEGNLKLGLWLRDGEGYGRSHWRTLPPAVPTLA